MIKVYITILAFIFAISCGGGSGSSEGKNEEKVSPQKTFYVIASGISDAVGLQIEFNIPEKVSNISVEKTSDLSDWTLKKSIEGNVLKVLAYNENLKPISKKTSLTLLKIKLLKDIPISLKSYKFVDSFGAPVTPENISLRSEK